MYDLDEYMYIFEEYIIIIFIDICIICCCVFGNCFHYNLKKMNVNSEPANDYKNKKNIINEQT